MTPQEEINYYKLISETRASTIESLIKIIDIMTARIEKYEN